MMELLNRIHNFKDDDAEYYARMMVDYCGSCIDNSKKASFAIDEGSAKWAGRGDCKPFPRMSEL